MHAHICMYVYYPFPDLRNAENSLQTTIKILSVVNSIYSVHPHGILSLIFVELLSRAHPWL